MEKLFASWKSTGKKNTSRKIILPWTIGKILQIVLPKIKFFFIRAIIVNGIKHARNKSAQAKLARYLLFVNRIGPRDPNITTNAAVFPMNARKNINNDMIFVTHSASVILVWFAGAGDNEEFRIANIRHFVSIKECFLSRNK